MKAVILAAGIASRLRPLTNHTPKCLLKIGAKNILAYTIDNLIANDIHDLIVVTGYLEQQIRDFISSQYSTLNVTYIYNEVYATTNNIYSLWLTKEHLQNDEMILLDSDILFEEKIISRLINSGYENCLALKQHEVHDEEIKVKADDTGRIMEIGKEVIHKDAIGESIGIEKFNAVGVNQLFEILDRKIMLEKNVNLFYETAFQEFIDAGKTIFVVDVTDCNCMEIDTAQDLELASSLIAS
jgi:choline kinase